MGRAIDMEKDIDMLKAQVKSLEDIVRGMTHTMDGLSEKSSTTEHIDLVDDVKLEEGKDGKKANNKTSSKSAGTSSSSTRSSKDANNKSRNTSK